MTTIERTDPQGRVQRVNVPRRAGPTDSEITQLKSMLVELDKLKTLITEMTKPLAITAADVATRNSRIATIAASIDVILNADYTKPAAPAQGGANPGANPGGGGNRPVRPGGGGGGGGGRQGANPGTTGN
jgi:hypothetical protein